jgi:phthiocerol/phenolphthiocerol synthesis type-I polyketide synthase E
VNTGNGIESEPDSISPNAIAVVGMAGRFPGANSVSALWRNLRDGQESIATLSEETLLASGVGEKALASAAYVRRAPLVDGIDEFDTDFFGFSPHSARTMDPQHRLFLQCAWHAFEDAGCDPATFDGAIGVYGTSASPAYLLHNLLSQYDSSTIIGQGANLEQLNLFLQTDKDFLATRVSHQFNLRGPGITVQTACSSSLVAVHLACQSLLNGECDMALAGGVSLRIPHQVGYWHDPGSMVSAVGHCRPFDVRADGTVFGSGVAIVVLKPLQAAIDDGDRIHAVILGSALNNDGSMKMGYAAPNAAAQADVIAEAHAVSGVDSSTISYVETHGTGTPLGDPIEIEGLRRAFAVSAESRRGPCVLSALKSNIGHLEVASGIAGMIKAILCLQHRAIPATLHYTRANPELRLDDSPFVVQSEYGRWDWDGVLRAGVSSFGVGGTNAHLVLEEAPRLPARAATSGPQVLLLSARTAEGLNQSRSDLATALSDSDPIDLTDAAFTLGSRRAETVRAAAVVNDREHAVSVLRAEEHDNVFVGEAVDGAGSRADRVVFLFPGQGAQHVGMARGLYESEPVFAEHFDQCAEGFSAELGIDLRDEIFRGAAAKLERTDRAQPALFAVEYSLAKLAESYGVRPAAMAGHSIGEYAAATLAGVFDLPTAVKVVSVRARLMHAAPPGVMVAVPVSQEDVAEYLTDGVDLAAINEPGNCVVSGSAEIISAFQQRLAQRGVTARRVRTSHAFHSSSMDGVLGEFQEFLSHQTLRKPLIPLLGNVTGTWLSADEVTNPATWAQQIRATVRFADELGAILADPHRVVVEVGPGGTLTASAIRHPKWSPGHRAVRLMRHQAQNKADRDAFLVALGQLWVSGVDVDWSPLSDGHTPRRITMPGYPFARQRHWIEPNRENHFVQRPTGTNGVSVHSSNNAAGHAAANGGSTIEATLQRILAQCLGRDSIDSKANFFELGGDSLIAVGVATSAASQGIDITPQDLYEYPSVSTLAAAVTARYVVSGLASVPAEPANPAVPPNIAYLLEGGLQDAAQWRIPLILRLAPDVTETDVRAVLAAVTNHHDALRLRVVERAGTWEQHFDEPGEFTDLATASLPAGVDPADARAGQEVLRLLADHIRGLDSSTTPLSAVYISDSDSRACHLAIAVHAMVADNPARDILLTDVFTAFGQRLAGDDIALTPATATWRQWSQRCAGLASHPAVLESRDHWLGSAAEATLRLADQTVSDPPRASDLARLSSKLTTDETAAVDDARRRLHTGSDEILLAALSRTIAATSGRGTIAVDLMESGRSVLKPDVDLRRSVGWFSMLYPVPLSCTTVADTGALDLLAEVQRTVKAVPHYGIGYGLLRYVYAPTARLLGAVRPPDIFFSSVGTIPELASVDAPVQFDSATAQAMADAAPGLGHAIELRVYRHSGVLHLDWWYDTRRVEQETAESLVRQYPVMLTDLIHEAIAASRGDDGDDEVDETLALVDLSLAEIGDFQ